MATLADTVRCVRCHMLTLAVYAGQTASSTADIQPMGRDAHNASRTTLDRTAQPVRVAIS